jgi:hypothetical protein
VRTWPALSCRACEDSSGESVDDQLMDELVGRAQAEGGTGTRSSVCTAPTEEAALDRFAEFADAWGRK